MRAELVDLNFKPWLKDRNYLCSLCNLNENESIFHFVAKCPILSSTRKRFLGNSKLTYQDYKSYLHGKDWVSLANFMSEAWKYRWQLVDEFNFSDS